MTDRATPPERPALSGHPQILYAVDQSVATLTLNRPENLNAFTRRMAADLIGLIDRVDQDDAVRAVIITGAGRAFSAGADLGASDSSFARKVSRPAVGDGNGDAHPVDWSDESVRDFGGCITLRLYDCLKPVIVAFNGAAAGMGVTLSLAADIRLAADTARFSMPFARRGIVPESASSWFLTRIVGISQALEWILTGRTFAAAEALAGGLVRSVHPPEQLLGVAYGLAREIADSGAPVSVALARQMLWKMLGADHPMEAHKIESRGVFSRARSGDIREGVDSFLQKRAPRFTDRVSADMPDFYPWWNERRYE